MTRFAETRQHSAPALFRLSDAIARLRPPRSNVHIPIVLPKLPVPHEGGEEEISKTVAPVALFSSNPGAVVLPIQQPAL